MYGVATNLNTNGIAKTATTSNQLQQQQLVQKKQQDRMLPLPKAHPKVPCPSPPAILKDKRSTVHFTKGPLLGEGGFAKCYEVVDPHGVRFAAKVVAKQSLKTEKSKQKLFTEIKIHQNLRHTNIVRFQQVFEDTQNVYMIMELCHNKTFVEMLRKRKRLSEAESRYYVVQLVKAIAYMHQKRVIHRDLKLGNLFLDSDMNIKIGQQFFVMNLHNGRRDFGLATVVKFDGERKKTICGTPNYIAPEILFDRQNGHSFEVDMWSLGVVLYTFVVGRPPFQTKDVKAIYQNIKENRYQFPDGCQLSGMVRDLIGQLLSSAADQRPTIQEVLDHPWLQLSIPLSIPVNALLQMPQLDCAAAVNVANRLLSQVSSGPVNGSKKPLSPAQVKQAVQLFNSHNINNKENNHENMNSVGSRVPLQSVVNVSNKVSASKDSPLYRPSAVDSAKQLSAHQQSVTQSPKLSVASPTPAAVTLRHPAVSAVVAEQRLPIAPASSPNVTQLRKMSLASNTNGSNTASVQSPKTPGISHASVVSKMELSPAINSGGKRSMLETMLMHLNIALDCQKEGKLFPINVPADMVSTPRVFISKWIDYSNKYGLGYQLTNGCIGVNFNDSSSIILSANDVNFEYLEYARGTNKTVMNRHAHTLQRYPETLQKKATLLQHFKSYMSAHLYKASAYTYQDTERTSNMDFLVKYMRTKHAVMFRLTNRVVQINFFDHSKLILSRDGLVVTFISRDRELCTYSLAQALQQQDKDIAGRLKYASEILQGLTTAATSTTATVSAKSSSKMSNGAGQKKTISAACDQQNHRAAAN